MAGLANLSEFFENPLFTETIREVPVETGYIGSRFLPSENTYDMEWNETVIERQADMADLVDAGAELPLTDRDPVSRIPRRRSTRHFAPTRRTSPIITRSATT